MSDSYTTKTGEWVGDSLPTVINATKVVSYTVADVVKAILEDRESSVWVNGKGETGGQPADLEVTIEHVLSRIDEWARGDLSCQWGHEDDLTGVIFTDENGTPL